jgi:hypothetical protein
LGTTQIGIDVVLAASGNRVYVAALQATPRDVMFVASSDAGNTFGAPINLTNSSQVENNVRVAASSSNVAVVWNNEFRTATSAYEVATIRTSTDGGVSFGAPIGLSGQVAIGSTIRVAAYMNRVSVLMCHPRTSPPGADSYLRTSNDAGATFSTPQLISANVNCYANEISAIGDRVYIIWSGRSAGQENVFTRVSLDGGVTFSPEINVSNSARRARFGQLAAVGQNVYVVWQQEVTNNAGATSDDIYFARSTDNGTSYSTPINLSQGFDDLSWNPILAASGDYVHVLWQDYGVGNSDVYYRRSADAGASFGPASPLPPGPSNPLYDGLGQAAARGSSLYATWYRQRNGQQSSELFYYSKRVCPQMPNEDGPFRCLTCC